MRVVFLPEWVCLGCMDEMGGDGPKLLVIPHVGPEGGIRHDPEVGALCVVQDVGGLRVGLVCNVDVVRG